MASRGTSDEAIWRGTAKPWSFWRSTLDRWGAKGRSHSEIARDLGDQPGVSSWWAQALTVRYEQERGLRGVGQNRLTNSRARETMRKRWRAALNRLAASQ